MKDRYEGFWHRQMGGETQGTDKALKRERDTHTDRHINKETIFKTKKDNEKQKRERESVCV